MNTRQEFLANWNKRVADAEAAGCVIINGKMVPVEKGAIDKLFSGTKDAPADWINIPCFKRSGGLVSDDLKRWRVWCPCVADGLPVCESGNPSGLPQGVDLDENGVPL